MTGVDLKTARRTSDWTQVDAALRLGVTQAYLSMVERGVRPVSEELASAARKLYRLSPTTRPLRTSVGKLPESFYQAALGELGYPGFSYLKGGVAMNPATLLFLALDEENLDARVVEALPWLPLQFPELDWEWTVANVKLRDRQNRLAFVTGLAVESATERKDTERTNMLSAQVERLERSRLASEDTLCKASLSKSERTWLHSHRSPLAKHWNLLTDLTSKDLVHAS